MQRTQLQWQAELSAYSPQTSDYVELAGNVSTMDYYCWRDELRAAFADCDEDLPASWEAYIHAQNLAIPLEQCCLDGAVLAPEERNDKLEGCPVELKAALDRFFLKAPLEIQEYLFLYFSSLVQIERNRRTGRPDWDAKPQSGSPEVLQELMFKWGPRFKRFHPW